MRDTSRLRELKGEIFQKWKLDIYQHIATILDRRNAENMSNVYEAFHAYIHNKIRSEEVVKQLIDDVELVIEKTNSVLNEYNELSEYSKCTVFALENFRKAKKSSAKRMYFITIQSFVGNKTPAEVAILWNQRTGENLTAQNIAPQKSNGIKFINRDRCNWLSENNFEPEEIADLLELNQNKVEKFIQDGFNEI